MTEDTRFFFPGERRVVGCGVLVAEVEGRHVVGLAGAHLGEPRVLAAMFTAAHAERGHNELFSCNFRRALPLRPFSASVFSSKKHVPTGTGGQGDFGFFGAPASGSERVGVGTSAEAERDSSSVC